VIVRLMGEGQYRIDEEVRSQLNELDEQAVRAMEGDDEPALDGLLDRMWDLVEERGDRLPDDEIATSDLIIPPSDLTLEETRKLFTDEGLVPDLPTR
jgi:PspAA-like protein